MKIIPPDSGRARMGVLDPSRWIPAGSQPKMAEKPRELPHPHSLRALTKTLSRCNGAELTPSWRRRECSHNQVTHTWGHRRTKQKSLVPCGWKQAEK